MKKGIFLVANLKSQALCENLVYSIRGSGCTLPIRLIHFGGDKINSKYLLNEVEFLSIDDFSEEAKHFILNIGSVLTDCPTGFLYRFLAFFTNWDAFLYADNDIVALTNWDKLFDFLPDYNIVHADEEYSTYGRYNHENPDAVNEIFGSDALEKALTAGHFVAKNHPKLIADINKAVEWFKQNPGIPKKHDQSLLHITALLGNWKMLNLCKPPHNWLSSWSGDYKNSLDLIQMIQGVNNRHISHIHYSGGVPLGNLPIEDLLYSNLSNKYRLIKYIRASICNLLYIDYLNRQRKKAFKVLRNTIKL